MFNFAYHDILLQIMPNWVHVPYVWCDLPKLCLHHLSHAWFMYYMLRLKKENGTIFDARGQCENMVGSPFEDNIKWGSN